MTDIWYPDTVIDGVPVVAAPAEIDITNADGLRSALFQSGRGRPRHARGRYDPDPVL